MKMVPVESTNIEAVGYDPDRKEMRLAFKSGDVHEYVDVPPEAHSRLMAASSHGGHFHAHIRGKFTSRKLGGAVAEPEPVPQIDPPDYLDAAIRRFRGQ